MKHFLSVLIPAFNEEAGLPNCITNVRRALDRVASLLRGFEIIVCDNNSTDRTGPLAKALGCTVVFEPINQIARSRNAAARVASGDWLLFVDADAWPTPELLEDAIHTMETDRYIDCGSTIRIVDGPLWFKWAWESKNFSMRIMKWCPGGFLFCRKDAFTAIGGFPDDQFIFEEAEFVRRLKRYGRSLGLRFTILHRYPFHASGRKGAKYGFISWLATAFRFWLSPHKLSKDKDFASKWYDPRR